MSKQKRIPPSRRNSRSAPPPVSPHPAAQRVTPADPPQRHPQQPQGPQPQQVIHPLENPGKTSLPSCYPSAPSCLIPLKIEEDGANLLGSLPPRGQFTDAGNRKGERRSPRRRKGGTPAEPGNPDVQGRSDETERTWRTVYRKRGIEGQKALHVNIDGCAICDG